MRQRNDGAYPLTAHTDPPQVVDPGQVIDWPDPVIGLTPVTDPQPAPVKAPKAAKEADR